MKQSPDLLKIVEGVAKCVAQMEQAYLELLLELYRMGWITMSTLETKLVEHQVYQGNRLAELNKTDAQGQ